MSGFAWTPRLTKKLFEMRFQNEWLFKTKRQPWQDFRDILLKNGFPAEMTVDHIRKKWAYSYHSYTVAKQTKNKSWIYYKIFEKYFGKTPVLDKYSSWNEEWRLKLILVMTEVKALKLTMIEMWKQIEKSLRSQNLPSECCVLDIKGLWQHLKTTFNRKHRIALRRGGASPWPLYAAMLAYHGAHERDWPRRLGRGLQRERPERARAHSGAEGGAAAEFQWTKDITETFIQIRLQNDFLFREKKWVWNDILKIMVEEYGFPKTLTGRDLCRKWTSTYSDYQKSVATNNPGWVYYNLFRCYLGDGIFSLNPLVGWQEEWVKCLVRARSAAEPAFVANVKHGHADDELRCWREVEKTLRGEGLPLDHSLLDIPEMWTHLIKTYRWKKKFADKGTLTEHWPYYELMAAYTEAHDRLRPARHATRHATRHTTHDAHGTHDEHDVKLDVKYCPSDAAAGEDYDDDDVKLFDLKRRLARPAAAGAAGAAAGAAAAAAGVCRACNAAGGVYNIFEPRDERGLDLAHKIRLLADLEITATDELPKQICFGCLQELERAFAFRLRCRDAARALAAAAPIKLEAPPDPAAETNDQHDYDEYGGYDAHGAPAAEPVKKEPPRVARRKKKRHLAKYRYFKMCEICGKNTSNLKDHLDAHSSDKLHQCDRCDKRFKFKSGLQIHRAVHDPVPKKTCEVCGKKFHIVAQYRRHFVYHANERRHACESCGKRFNTLDILKVHMRTHTDERPFECVDCGKFFRTAGCVSRHRRIVHRMARKAADD